MPGLKGFFSHLRRHTAERRAAPRYTTHLSEALVVYLYHAEQKTREGSSEPEPRLIGYTRDVSETGLGVVLSSLRLAGLDITHGERKLRALVGIPSSPVGMQVMVVRHVELEPDGADSGFLVGVRITEMHPADRTRYLKYLKQLSVGEM